MAASLKIKLYGLKCLLVVYGFLSYLSTGWRNDLLIVGFNKTTLLDYPGRVAATVFTGGCNFRCPFCHNGGLVLSPLSQESYSEEEILEFLKKRRNVLKGVCITGGEPALHADLPEFISEIKDLGYQVKLDTNGYAPKVLKKLLDEELLDYVAMDIKNCREKYALTAGREPDVFHVDKIDRSISILKEASVPYEFRTTVVKELHTREDMVKIAQWIKGCPRYFLQQYQDSENILYSMEKEKTEQYGGEERFEAACFHGYTREEMEQIAGALRKVPGMTGDVSLRGVE